MSQSKIMICCESCVENSPEGCGHFSTNDLRVARDGRWLCEDCFDEDRATRDETWGKAKKVTAAKILDAAKAVRP